MIVMKMWRSGRGVGEIVASAAGFVQYNGSEWVLRSPIASLASSAGSPSSRAMSLSLLPFCLPKAK
ncbi:hypothetical protein D3C77_507350 [compost metagenome]